MLLRWPKNMDWAIKFSAMMESLIFKYGHILDSNYAIGKIKENLKKRFALKGNNLAQKKYESDR